ncbi:glycoside hydrolase family 88 protein, partial [candidate division KSB1 bacterium]
FTMVRGSRWTSADVSLSGNWSGLQFITGIPIRPDEKILTGDDYIASFAGMPALGLAVYVPEEYIQDIREHNGYHLVYLKPDETGHIKYAFSGHWELEHNENVVEPGESNIKLPSMPWRQRFKRAGRALLRPQSRLDNIDKFKIQLNEDLASIIRNQPIVENISEKAVTYTELYPPEAVRKNPKKSYHEALNLMIDRLHMFAEEGLAIKGKEKFWITSDTEGMPNFIEPNKSWGDGYWVSMLWDAYKITGDTQFKKWALQSNKAMFGGEDMETFNTGVNYWLSSVRSYNETKDTIWRDSAIRCAETWLSYTDPVPGFIPGHGLKAKYKNKIPNDPENWTKIDAMICIPIMYWAYQETKEKKYLDMASRHSDLSILTLIEPDGSVHQSIYYSPRTGKILGIGTPQGCGGRSRWARGQAWALDGFADTYIFTRKQRYSEVFRLCAKWLMENLPKDFVPWYDFDDQGVFYRFRDTSTAAISAHALLRMANVEKDSNLASWYTDSAVKIIDFVIDNYLTKVGNDDSRPPGMLSHGCYTKIISDTQEQIWGSYNLMKALILLTERGIQRK